MSRRKRTELQEEFIYGRWQIFGEWVTQQRLIVGLTQQKAADAVGVSRRQWIRFELGTAKVPVKRMKAMSKILHVTEERMWDRAGYKISYKRLAPKIGWSGFMICSRPAT
jgi:transcriptional regulator with XRE-family HTH domain